MLDDVAWLAARTFLAPVEPKSRLSPCEERAGFTAGLLEPARGVVVPPTHVEAFSDTDCRMVSLAGFPTGRHHRLVKAAEARLAIHAGAAEVWVVPDPAAGDENALLIDFAAFREAVPAPAQLGLVVGEMPRTALEPTVRAARAAGIDRLVVRPDSAGDSSPGRAALAAVSEVLAASGGGIDIVYWAATLDEAVDGLAAETAAAETAGKGTAASAAVLPPRELTREEAKH